MLNPNFIVVVLIPAFLCQNFCCSPLYDEVILLCLDLGELDAAIAIVADMETAGIQVPDETLDKILSARQGVDSTEEEES